DAELESLFRRYKPFQQPLGERLPFQELHDEVLDAILVADVVERADVRMRELGDRLRLPFEPLPYILAPGEMLRQDLDCNRALQPRVPRLVDLAHPSRANGREDLVGSESGAGRESHLLLQPRPPVLHDRDRPVSVGNESVDQEALPVSETVVLNPVFDAPNRRGKERRRAPGRKVRPTPDLDGDEGLVGRDVEDSLPAAPPLRIRTASARDLP